MEYAATNPKWKAAGSLHSQMAGMAKTAAPTIAEPPDYVGMEAVGSAPSGMGIAPTYNIAQSNILTINAPNGELLVSINNEGQITYGLHYTPDAAAIAFWAAMAKWGLPVTINPHYDEPQGIILNILNASDDWVWTDL